MTIQGNFTPGMGPQLSFDVYATQVQQLGQAGYQNLGVEELLEWCEQRLRESDGEIRTKMVAQQDRTRARGTLAMLLRELKNQRGAMKDDSVHGDDRARARGKVDDAFDRAIASAPAELKGALEKMKGDFNGMTNLPLDAEKGDNRNANRVSEADMDKFADAIESKINDLQTAEQIEQIKLTSAVEARARMLSLTNKIVASFHETAKELVRR